MRFNSLLMICCLTVFVLGTTIDAQDKPTGPQQRPLEFQVDVSEIELNIGSEDKTNSKKVLYGYSVVSPNGKKQEQIKELLIGYGVRGEKLEHLMLQIKKILELSETRPLVQLRVGAVKSDAGVSGQVLGVEKKEATDKPGPQVANDRPKTATIRSHKLDARGFEKRIDFESLNLTKEQTERVRKAYQQATNEVGSPFERIIIGRHTGLSPKKGDTAFLMLAAPSRFVIGLDCVSASDVVRSQLKIGKSGLVVNGVSNGTPAQKAGIRKFDVLTTVDGKKLATLKELVESIQKAGKTKTALTFTLIREGQEHKLQVQPVEQKRLGDGWQRLLIDRSGAAPKVETRLLRITPSQTIQRPQGANKRATTAQNVRIYRANRDEDLKKMQQQIDQLQGQIKELHQLFKNSKQQEQKPRTPR